MTCRKKSDIQTERLKERNKGKEERKREEKSREEKRRS
jgi:hypothetical protein